MKNWKRVLSLCLALVLCAALSGCGTRELYERLLIQGIGVDLRGDEFTVTVRCSQSTEDEGEEFFKCRGSSVLEAMNSLSLSTGRKPFYAQNYLVVFGKECAKLGLDKCLDFFVRYHNTRPSVRMYVSQTSAEDVLGAQQDGKYRKMGEIQRLSREGASNGMVLEAEVLDFICGVKREGSSPILPVLKAEDGVVEAVGSAYFKGYRLEGFLSLEQTRGYLAAMGQLKQGTVVTESGDKKVTLSLSDSAGEIVAKTDEGDSPGFLMRVSLTADVSAVSGGKDSLDGGYTRLEKDLAQKLQGEIDSAVKQAVQKDRCDIFGLGNRLYQSFPRVWKQRGKDWENLLDSCPVQVEVSAKIRRIEQEVLSPLDP